MRRKYPYNKDLVNAIRSVVYECFLIEPQMFYEAVINKLSKQGFDTRYVTVKRIWRIYEEMVRRKVISDVLSVVESKNNGK
jgi:hypothetical protein